MQEAEELYDLREAMEAFAVEKATVHLTQAALEPLHRKMDCYGEGVHKRFSRKRLVYDQDVHMEIAQLTANETLKNSLCHVFERIVLKRRIDGLYDPARRAAVHQDHLKLLEAMERQDVEEAVRVVHAHV